MTNRFFVWACAMALLGACSSNDNKDGGERRATVVKAAIAQAAGDTNVYQFPCKVKAGSEVHVAFKVAGTLKRMAVQEGQSVAAGQLLAEMDDTDYRVQLSATEAEYEQVKAEAERVIKLYEQGGTTASNYDKARYGLQQITAKLQNHRNQLAYCKIYAPTASIVQTTLFEGGETLAAGMPVIQLIGCRHPEVEITVPASVYRHIKDIQTATASFNAIQGEEFKLHLLNVLPKANANGMYPVRLAIEGKNMPSPGMNGWVLISTKATGESHEILVPSTAVVHDSKLDYIFTVKGHKAHKVPVRVIALTANGHARVTGDISGGESVITSGVHMIKDGDEVEVLQPAAATNIGALM